MTEDDDGAAMVGQHWPSMVGGRQWKLKSFIVCLITNDHMKLFGKFQKIEPIYFPLPTMVHTKT